MRSLSDGDPLPPSTQVSSRATPANRWESWWSACLLGIWFGLVAGLTESLLRALEHHFHLTVLATVRPYYEWAPSIVYTCLFGFAGVAAGLGLRLLPQRWRSPLGFRVVLTIFAAVYFFGVVDHLDSFLEFGINDLSQAILALGLASLAGQGLTRCRERFHQCVCYGVPAIASLVFIWSAAAYGPQWWQKQRVLAAPSQASADTPNVILIVWDTVRAESLSLYGHDRPTTPTLQRLADSAVVFDNAIASASWTLPSHAGIFTGRPLHDFPQIAKKGLPQDATTLAEVLRGKGYLTAGFAANTAYCHRHTGLAQGFLYYDDLPWTLTSLVGQTRLVTKLWSDVVRPLFAKKQLVVRRGRSAADINRALLDWRDHAPQRPFFVFLNYLDAHHPYYPPKPFDEQYGPTGDADWEILAKWMDWLDNPRQIAPSQYKMALKAYEGCIAYLDQQLGLLLDELQQRGDLDNTLVIITSDHGEGFGEHGEYLHGTSLYQQQTRVPLLVLSPGRVPGGLRVRETVSLRDLPATVMDLLQAGEHCLPGASLTHLWDENGGRDDPIAASPVLSELEPFWHVIPPASPVAKGPIRALWSGDQKYIYRDREPIEELYDLEHDPLERRNLASQERPAVDTLRRRLARLLPGTDSTKPPAMTAALPQPDRR